MKPIQRSLVAASILAAFLAPSAPVFAQHAGHVVVAQAPAAAKVAETGAVLRDAWVGHVFWVRNVVVATFAGDKQAAAAAEKEVVAKFLSGANPNLPFDTLNGLLLAHGGHHIQGIQQIKGQQYAEEAQTWEAMKQHMYVIADALAGAIARQFPAKFS